MASSSEPVYNTEQEVIARFQELRQSISKLFAQLNDIEAEAAEHDLVIKQLEPMDKSRKCFRLIGDVLVERTVNETLPAVKRNYEGLTQIMQQMKSQLESQQKALAAHQQKYKIRISQPGVGDDAGEQASSSSSKKQSKGSNSNKGGVLI